MWMCGKLRRRVASSKVTGHLLGVIFVAALLSSGDGVQIRSGSRHQRVKVGGSVTFHCATEIEGEVTRVPRTEWYKDERQVVFQHPHPHPHHQPQQEVGDNSRRLFRDAVDGSLTIWNVSASDAGLYTCLVVVGKERDTASSQLIVEDVPGQPTDVILTHCEDRIAQLHWRAPPQDASQLPVTRYVIQYNMSFEPDTWHTAKTAQPATNRTIQRIALSPWGNYSFRVLAENAIGTGRSSVPTADLCSTPADVPHLNPRGVCTRNTHPGELTIVWEPMPKQEQNGPGFYYVVKWRRADAPDRSAGLYHERVLGVEVTSLVIRDQPPYRPYDIYVISVNAMGEAAAKPRPVIGYSSEDVPTDVPVNFVLDPRREVTNTTADFVWDAINASSPGLNGFLRGYKIEYWQTHVGRSTLREHRIIFQEPGPCWLQQQHASGQGQGHPGGGGGGGGGLVVNGGHIFNLWPFTTVSAQVRVLTAKYESHPSQSVTFTTKEGVPGPVKNFEVIKKSSTHFEISWKRPAETNGILYGYELTVQALSSDEVLDDSSSTLTFDIDSPLTDRYKVSDLRPSQAYTLGLCARTGAGKGPVSYVEDKTLYPAPSVPNFTLTNISDESVNVTWFQMRPADSSTSFDVLYRIVGDEAWQHVTAGRGRSWLVVEGLSPDVVYEMRVVARAGRADSDDSATYSDVQRVRLGVKRESAQPTFKVHLIERGVVGITLDKVHERTTAFYLQYRHLGWQTWTSTADVPVRLTAVLKGLDPSHTYEFRIVTKGPYGEISSAIQEIAADANYAGLSSDDEGQGSRKSASQSIRSSSSSSSSHCVMFYFLLLASCSLRLPHYSHLLFA